MNDYGRNGNSSFFVLIDAELNDLPVLKRACERYLCGELNTVIYKLDRNPLLDRLQKKDLLTSLLLDLLFISIVFNLNVMKSMTLSELSTQVRFFQHNTNSSLA